MKKKSPDKFCHFWDPKNKVKIKELFFLLQIQLGEGGEREKENKIK